MGLIDLFYKNFERTYENKDDFFKDMFLFIRPKTSSDEIITTINHEVAHFEKARELGYNPVYGIMKKNFKIFHLNFSLQIPHVRYEKEPKPQDLVEIALAPENPSLIDRIHASNFFQFYYRFRHRNS